MKKEIAKIATDNGAVKINNIYFPCDGDGVKSVYLTDELEPDFRKPFIDLRENDLKLYGYDRFGNSICESYTKEYFGTPIVSIEYDITTDSILIIKYKFGEKK